ncbi:ABC transporter ATP-binding protein [Streptomyces sp. NPDC023327]|uniref:ABC transporter ATP-binding protein n=1 Tax=Streptomyces sp. NPDC023327 TaxID=3157088 RepID=UPI0033F41C00
MNAIEVRDVHRMFRSSRRAWPRAQHTETTALRGIDLDVPAGSLFGLLGPNGAGKTTTVKILTTLLLPTSGRVWVDGIDAVAQPQEVRRRIGCALGGDRGFYDRLSAEDNLRYFADLYGIEPRAQRIRVAEVLALADLADRRKDRVEGYSRGMKQRLHIARSLLRDPDVLFLDEPTNGLDPVAARDIRAAINQLRAVGKTILLTTHYMFEAEELCDRLAVISEGRIVVEGTAQDLAAEARTGVVVRAETRGAEPWLCQLLEARADVLNASQELLEDRELTTVRMAHGRRTEAEYLVREVLEDAPHVRVLDIASREPSLEDSYVALVSRSLIGTVR